MCVFLGFQVHYKKQYEQTKAHYQLVLDTAEQRHHKDNAVLLSQVPVDVTWQQQLVTTTVAQSQRCMFAGAGEVQRGV